jgi:HEAT repeat protein
VLRLAAVETLGRFEDPRVAGVLLAAYRNAHGRPDGAPDPLRSDPALQLASGINQRIPGRMAALPLTAPTGYPPDTVETIRCRTLEAIGRTSRPEVVPFLAAVASGQASDPNAGGADDRDVRLAAIRGLGKCRQPEAVAALTRVLSSESGKDTAITGRAHDGLVRLTGKRLPADPEKWNEVVPASGWFKK